MFRTNANGGAICAHRDLSICTPCLATVADRAVVVYGEVYVYPTVGEAQALVRALTSTVRDLCADGYGDAS